MSSRPPAKDSKEESVDYWLAQANKANPPDEAQATQKQLCEESLEQLKADAKKLDETRWLYEEQPKDRGAREASVGL